MPAIALIQPIHQQLCLGKMHPVTRQHATTGQQITFAQGTHDPVVIHPLPAGFAHRAADRRVATTPQQPSLQLINARERKNAPAYLFPYQVNIGPHLTLFNRQQRRVVRE
ncbi:hypothetical protein D3C76_1332800 [compost metagenome]